MGACCGSLKPKSAFLDGGEEAEVGDGAWRGFTHIVIFLGLEVCCVYGVYVCEGLLADVIKEFGCFLAVRWRGDAGCVLEICLKGPSQYLVGALCWHFWVCE